MWNILKTVKKGDYLYAVVKEHPNANKFGYVLAHRVIMENFLGRLLNKNEVVHHIDGNKHNNNINNLEVLDAKEHNRIHSTKGRTISTLHCGYCGKEFTRETRLTYGKYAPMCSRRCNGLNNKKNLKYL